MLNFLEDIYLTLPEPTMHFVLKLEHTVLESLAGRMFSKFTLFKHLVEKVWRMNKLAKGLSMVTTNLDGFTLANLRRFTKFAEVSTHQTFPLHGIYAWPNSIVVQVYDNMFSCSSSSL